jgi:hypothetical protein
MISYYSNNLFTFLNSRNNPFIIKINILPEYSKIARILNVAPISPVSNKKPTVYQDFYQLKHVSLQFDFKI